MAWCWPSLLIHCFFNRRNAEWVDWKAFRNSFDPKENTSGRCLEAASTFLLPPPRLCFGSSPATALPAASTASYSGCSLSTSSPCWPALGLSGRLTSMCRLGKRPWGLQRRHWWGWWPGGRAYGLTCRRKAKRGKSEVRCMQVVESSWKWRKSNFSTMHIQEVQISTQESLTSGQSRSRLFISTLPAF